MCCVNSSLFQDVHAHTLRVANILGILGDHYCFHNPWIYGWSALVTVIMLNIVASFRLAVPILHSDAPGGVSNRLLLTAATLYTRGSTMVAAPR